MDGFFIEYRDPLFGIIILLLLVFIISFSSYFWSLYRYKRQKNSLQRFSKRFDFAGKDRSVAELIRKGELGEGLMHIASIYSKSGQMEEAIRIYNSALEGLKSPKEKTVILERLGRCYFETGFLQRAREIFLQVLKNFPRSIDSLNYLLLIEEQLGNYKDALEVLEVLEELDEDVIREKLYFQTLLTLKDGSLDKEERLARLEGFLQKDSGLYRIIQEQFCYQDSARFWRNIKRGNPLNIADLLWGMEKDALDMEVVADDGRLQELYLAKGYLEKEEAEFDSFDLEQLYALRIVGFTDYEAVFEYLCSSCRGLFPVPFRRCPSCYSLLESEVSIKATRRSVEACDSLQ